jgi:preprotein translocase subunit Sec63
MRDAAKHEEARPAAVEKMVDLYEVLGVPKRASEKDISAAYKKLALKYVVC